MRSSPRPWRQRLGLVATGLTALSVSVVGVSMPSASAAVCGTANVAQGKPALALSYENDGTQASAAFDGNTGTRWSSKFEDPQWIRVDLGSAQQVCKITLNWETARAATFKIQVSPDGDAWTDATPTLNGTDTSQTVDLNATGRYVRMYGLTRNTQWGYSLWEMAVNVLDNSGGGTLPGGGDLGPNVKVFDPSMSSASIQSTLDSVFATQEKNQFGNQRYALLFKPGTYSNLNAQVGFYTSVAGLGQSPDNVTINGDVTVDAGWFGGNATQNFWRSVENLAIVPSNGTDRWAVAQAAPFRRIHVRGGLNLAPNGYGWASGGYIADSKIDGTVGPYSQQQWFTRDSQIGGWTNGVWNMVFSGVVGAPAPSFLPNNPYTVIPQSPVTREKPYLYMDGGGAYRVFVPSLRQNSSGVSWANGATPGTSLPLSQFYVAKPSDSAATLNQALAQGLNLLFTPGVYHINQTINVTRADTVVLGLGYATLIPDNGVVPMTVADVDGVKIASLLFDAGTTNSPVLLRVGPDGSSAGHAADPSSIQDVFFRIGGAVPGKATTSLVVNENNAIIDHIWAWRADHGNDGTYGWNVNPADTGLIVNGSNVTAYGLFVEHYQKYEVIWNGNGGKTIFFQNEMPYDPPNLASWMNGSTRGYAAYKVANTVTQHEAWGMGSYCNFTADPTIVADRGFETPVNPAVKFHNLLTVSLGGKGLIAHVINNTGAQTVVPDTIPSPVDNFPS